MKLLWDLRFFPALRDLCCTPDMIALRTRNMRRLEQAKQSGRNVCREITDD